VHAEFANRRDPPGSSTCTRGGGGRRRSESAATSTIGTTIASTHRGHGHWQSPGAVGRRRDDGRDLRPQDRQAATARAAPMHHRGPVQGHARRRKRDRRRRPAVDLRDGRWAAQGSRANGGGPAVAFFSGDGGQQPGHHAGVDEPGLGVETLPGRLRGRETTATAESTSSNLVGGQRQTSPTGRPGSACPGRHRGTGFDFFAVHEAASEAIARAPGRARGRRSSR